MRETWAGTKTNGVAFLALLLVAVTGPVPATHADAGADEAAIAVAAGDQHTCALLASGNVACWGSNVFGQAEPYMNGDALEVGVGANFSCVRVEGGIATCWGAGAGEPWGYGGGEAVGLAVGDGHGCVLLANKSVACWTANKEPWVAYAGQDAVEVVAGHEYTCVRRAATDPPNFDLSIECWADATLDDDYGQTGTYYHNNVMRHVDVSEVAHCMTTEKPYGKAAAPPVGCVSPVHPRAVAAGAYHTCALADEDVLCWGRNDEGQAEPGSDQAFVMVALGERHTCALRAGGNVHCWGYNGGGAAADYTGGGAVHISAGRAHVCAVLAAGAVACWGENTSGQAESYDPRPVALEGSGIGERGEAGPEPTGAFDDQDPDTDPQVAGLSPWLVGGLPALFVLVVLLVVLLLVARRDRGGAVAVAPVVEPVLAPGQPFLDKYLVKRALGRGAFGTTYLATHVDLKRDVVIKQLRPEWSVQEETRVRFQREAQILAALDHPNITRVFDVERTQTAHFIVMEYVAGGNLKERFGGTIDEGGTTSAADHGAPEADQTQVFAAAAVDRPVVVPGLRVEVAVRILGDVLDGLDYLHGRGVLHRDLKPANVLLTSDGRAKIADFGVSREAGQDASVVTVAGSPLGTPLFMAPEQVLGRPVDARADLYAAAATFYWILAGQPYVGGASTSVHELQRQIVEDPPSLPLVDVPEGLNRWLARGLAKLPEERFQTAREAAEALRCA